MDDIIHFFGGLTDDDKKKKIRERVIDTVKNIKDNPSSILELSKKIDDGSTEEENKWKKKRVLGDYYTNTKLEAMTDYFNKKKEEEKKEEEKVRYVTEYIEVESAQSRRIREQRALQEKNRNIASRELPKILGNIKMDFSQQLNGKILKKKEKIKEELNKYSPTNLKSLFRILEENEKIKNKLIEDSKKETEKILNKSYENSCHFNILLLGKTGVGKSTLINGIFEFNEIEGAKTGVGKPITQNFDEYTSDKRKCLRIIDSKGIELGEHNINTVFNSAKGLIEKKAFEGDPDKLIHCIWYCFKSDILRFEDIEKDTVSLLMNQYGNNDLPVIIVITQNYDDTATKTMIDLIKNEFKFLNREMVIVPVVAKEQIIEKKKNKLVIQKEGIEDLIKISFEKSQKAIYPAIMKSIQEKICQTFVINSKNKKNKLKNELNEIAQKTLNGITENENIESSIFKLSSIVVKILNNFFDVPLISEKSKYDITKFLDNLCKWCIGILNNIISESINENSNELGLLLCREQTKVKKKYNVEIPLTNEKTIDEFRMQSEHDLKPSIIKKVYFLAIKYIYNIILKNILKICEEVFNEEFNKIVPQFKKNIPEEKLKQLSKKILQNIIKNK